MASHGDKTIPPSLEVLNSSPSYSSDYPSPPLGRDDEEKAPSILSTALPLPEAPDGGTRAWLQVAGSFLVFGNLWGITFAFGTFQSYYELTYLPSYSASSISWIGTISTFLLILGGIASGPLFDWGYFRSMLIAGALIETLAVMLLSLCRKYWQIFLTQGVLMGLGNGLLYIPGLALVGRAFKKHRAMAVGITTCGAPVGGIIYTITFEQLIGRMSFGWAVRIMGFVMLASYLIAFPLILWKVKNAGDIASGQTRKLFDKTAVKDLPFWSFTSSNFLIFTGYMVPFYFMASYGQTELGMNRSDANYVIVIAQACSVVGRIAAAATAAKIGVLIPWITCAVSSGVLCLGWAGVHSPGAFVAFAALYGCTSLTALIQQAFRPVKFTDILSTGFSGALIPLPPSVFPVVCPDPKVLGARLGMAQGIGSFASLIGSPIAAALTSINAQPGHPNYLGLQLFGGLIMALGGCNLFGLWALLVKQRELKSKFI